MSSVNWSGNDSPGWLGVLVRLKGAESGGELCGVGGGVRRGRPLPADAPRPRITGIRVVDGSVKLTVADTVPYLTCDVDGAATPHGFGRRTRRMARKPQDGRVGEAIEMEVPLEKGAEGARFIKVIRK